MINNNPLIIDVSEIETKVNLLQSTKQDKITGVKGQVVGFDEDGDVIAQTIADTNIDAHNTSVNAHPDIREEISKVKRIIDDANGVTQYRLGIENGKLYIKAEEKE